MQQTFSTNGLFSVKLKQTENGKLTFIEKDTIHLTNKR